MESAILKIGGMTCGGCVGSVTRVLRALPGVKSADVSLEKNEARVEFDPALTSLAHLKGAIENAGYEAH
jgi:copper chaperone